MELKIEDLAYQREAINAVVRLFDGQPRNTFDMACRQGVRSNVLTIPTAQVRENLLGAIEASGIDEETASHDDALDFCIEMETGTGKTLVNLKTAYELYRQYAFTKFIILVPPVAIKEGVLSTFNVFKRQLADKKAPRESEVCKIKCAMKHFDALGIDARVNYDAPVKEYSVFKTRATGVLHA